MNHIRFMRTQELLGSALRFGLLKVAIATATSRCRILKKGATFISPAATAITAHIWSADEYLKIVSELPQNGGAILTLRLVR